MHTSTWSLQDAKNNFSRVVEAAIHGEPQHVTRRGSEVVVIVAADEFERLEGYRTANMPRFVEHLLELPKDDGEFERVPFQSRAVEF